MTETEEFLASMSGRITEAEIALHYTVALEHAPASINGAEPRPYVLRVTTIFRLEDGDWKVVHRHGDHLASETGALALGLARPSFDRAG
jgi:ketosteroid isomerase-like protein